MTNHHNVFYKLKTIIKENGVLPSLQRIAFFSSGGITAQVIMMVNALIVARTLGPEQNGIYNGLYAILGVSITLVNFGFDQWMLKEAHEYPSVKIISGKIISVKFLLGLIWGTLCVIILPLSRPNYFTFGLVLLAGGDILADILFNSIVNSWTITRDIRVINLMLLASRLGKLLLLLFLIFSNYVFPVTITGSRFLISFIILLISLLILKPIFTDIKIYDLIRIFRESTAFGLSEVLSTIYAKIDVSILTLFSITDTGVYSPASGIINALFIIPNSIFIYLLPKYAKEVDSLEEKLFGSLPFNILLLFIIVGLALFLSICFCGKFLISFLLGARFIKTGQILQILSPILLFKSISFGLVLLIIITGNQQKRIATQLVVSLFNISLNLILIPLHGYIAVAWIYTISEFLLMSGYLITVIRIRKHEKNKNL